MGCFNNIIVIYIEYLIRMTMMILNNFIWGIYNGVALVDWLELFFCV